MKRVIILLTLIFSLILIVVALKSASDKNELTLCNTCPPGFELTDENVCKLRSLYQQYESVTGNDPGVGGLKTALPTVRDGFTPQQIDLGRYLFFDPVLSKDGSVSCATCHQPSKGFSDGLKTSVGIHNTKLKRAAPSLWNVAFYKKFFWDARSTSLEEQMTGPLYSEDEMGTTREQLLETLNDIKTYQSLFHQAFPKKKSTEIELNEIYTALTAFESSLISLNSRYDQYAHGYHEALSHEEIEGLNIFRSFVARCAECHTPPLFTNQQVAVIGLAEPDGKALDPGAQQTFQDPSLRGAFKVPSLRNIDRTAPYTHSGRFNTLREMIGFYSAGRGHEVAKNEKLHIHWHIWEPNLTNYEMDRLVDFVKTLTDESFRPQQPKVLPSGIAIDKPITSQALWSIQQNTH
ncbi:MAG TPA: cytochrome c peroxidase [Chryseolinea sp.]|nr:cytochrome c peroxidase [Chryseolinea sp.]HPH47018.1 cytochrome c peroxidase [Chryseolinea sp.]HPM32265.1 cytochrome c peroxidase [Chryseolinea sp.]